MRKTYNAQFAGIFAEAYAAYKKGDFGDAHAKLQAGLELKPNDGPSKTLIEVIEDFGMKAPEDWAGYRALTSK